MSLELNERGVQGRIAACAAAGALALAMMAGCGGASDQSSPAEASSASAEAAQVSSASAEASAASPAAASTAAAASSISASSASSSASAASQTLELGVTSDEARVIAVTNDIGDDITDIAFTEADSPDAPSYLMEDEEWKDGQKANVHFIERGTNINYDVLVESGDNLYELHNLPLDGVKALTVHLDGDVAYAEFEKNGSTVNTLEDELKYAAEEANIVTSAVDDDEEYYDDEYYYYEEDEDAEDAEDAESEEDEEYYEDDSEYEDDGSEEEV